MIQTGLVSITFRNLSPYEIVALVRRSGQQGIEWGGDVHVPHGNLSVAREVAAMTRNECLQVAAYGSYYRVGVSEAAGLAFNTVLETAIELQAPTVRVWAGDQASAETNSVVRGRIVEDARRIADLAYSAGLTVSFEFHGGTLTDRWTSAVKLYEEIGHEAIKLYWQPPVSDDETLLHQGLKQLMPYLTNVHVFHWTTDSIGIQRHPLSEGAPIWTDDIRTLSTSPQNHYAMIEFVKEDSPDQYLMDAQTLQEWVDACHKP